MNKVEAFIALGSNLGDRRAALRFAIDGLPGVTNVSHVYETDPVGGPQGQGPYLNMVVALLTTLGPFELLAHCQQLEASMGRIRTVLDGPRTLDVDVLLYGDLVINDTDLIVPHPRMWERRFVMEPLADVAPHRMPPDWECSIAPGGVWRTEPFEPESTCRVMGVLNVTPDSFSDGGLFDKDASAIEHGLTLWNQGAHIIDVGGESTRPGAQRVSETLELFRVLPVVSALCSQGVRVSIDTTRSAVARACVAAGASMVNDVSGGLGDPQMFQQVAKLAVPYVLMHWRSHSAHMTEHARYDDVVVDVKRELLTQVRHAMSNGIREDNIVIDPGIGFSKTADHNWKLLQNLNDLKQLGFPLLIGASRKRFLGELLSDDTGATREATQRDDATAAITTLVAYQGVWGVRVHDVKGSVDAIRVVSRIAKVR